MKKARKKQLVKNSAYKKAQNLQREPKKGKQNAKQQFKHTQNKSEQNAQKMHMHNHISHTTLFFCVFFPWLCILCAIFVRFVCLFCGDCCCVFSRKRTKNEKQSQKKANKCKGKDQNVFDRICLLFVCFFVFLCACVLHCLCFFFHLFSGQMFFSAFYLHFLCIPTLPL